MSEAALRPEEEARANFYALLARLFYAPPEGGLLELLAASGNLDGAAADSELASSWSALKGAAGATEVEAVREEYESLFGGAGKAAVTLYASAYLDPSGGRNPLVQLREFMSAHGIMRRTNAFEPEDHFAALCDMMRHLILRQAGIDSERELFAQMVGPAARLLCDAISALDDSRFYRNVAAFTRAFVDIEHAAFELM